MPPDVTGVTLRLNCPAGTIQTKAIASKTGERLLDIGIINASVEDKTYCSKKAFDDSGYNCAKYLSVDKIESTINVECVGKEGCSLDKFDSNFYRKNPPAANSKEFRECLGNGSQIFIQAACLLEEGEVAKRQFQGFYIAGIVLICGIYMLAYIDYIKLVAKNDYVEWDLQTITAGDFTIEFDISAAFYEKFVLTQGGSKPASASMGEHFRDWIHNEMENKLSKMDNLGYDD